MTESRSVVVWGWMEGWECSITRIQGPLWFLRASCSSRLAQVAVRDDGRGRREQTKFTNPFHIIAFMMPDNILLHEASHISELRFEGLGNQPSL